MIAQILANEVDLDIIRFIYPDGTSKTLEGWTEENFTTGEVTYYLKIGDMVLNDRDNELIKLYKDLDTKRYQATVTAHNSALEVLASPEFFSDDDYLKARELIYS